MGCNAGNFLLKNTPLVREYLDLVYRVYPAPHEPWPEQSAMSAVLAAGPTEARRLLSLPRDARPTVGSNRTVNETWAGLFWSIANAWHTLEQTVRAHDTLLAAERRAKVLFTPQCVMNAYNSTYQPGDFMLHFAGMGGQKPELIEHYLKKVEH